MIGRPHYTTLCFAAALSLFLSGCDKPEAAGSPKAPGIERLAICHYVPWQPLDKTVLLSQSYYDMPLMASPDDPVAGLRAEIEQMVAAGIDAIAVDIVIEKDHIAFEHQFGRMLEAAAGTSVRLFPCLNGVPKDDASTDRLAAIVKRWEKHPNWLRIDNRPVFSTFWGGRWKPEIYHNLEKRLAEQGISLFLLGDPDWVFNKPQTVETLRSYAGIFDVIYSFAEYGRGGNQSPLESYKALAEAAPEVARAKAWAAGIAPGYLGGWINGRNDYYIPFRNLDHFIDVWEAALSLRPDWVYISTWNDRDETHIQPTLYQWDTLVDISSFYIHLWKNGSPPDQARKFFAAYPREQLLGTTQRIEVVALPGSPREDAMVRGELRDGAGQVVAALPERSLAGDAVSRVDWAVDTLPLAHTPVVYPFLIVDGKEYRLPAFVLRSGWIENQNVVKFPLTRAADGSASLSVQILPENLVRATVEYAGSEPLRSAWLFRNDMRVASFDTSNAETPRAQLLLIEKKSDFSADISVRNGRFLRAFRSDGNASDKITLDAERLRTRSGVGQRTAFEIASAPDTELVFKGPTGSETVLSLAAIREAGTALDVGELPIRIQFPRFDALSDAVEDLSKKGGTLRELSATLDLGTPRPGESFHVRLETVSGKVLETPWVFPGLDGAKAQAISVIHSPSSLDNPKGVFLSEKLPPTQVRALRVDAHPAILQSSRWTFDDPVNPGRDSLARNSLTLGRGEGYLGVDAKRIPKHALGEGPDGSACLSFDGVDDRAQLPVQQEPKGPFRIAFDLFPAGPPKGWQNILTGEVDASQKTAAIIIRRLEDGRIAAGRGTLAMVKSPEPIPADRWTHVEIQFSGDETRLLLDGRLVAQAAGSPDFRRFGNSRVYLGGPKSPFHGKIDNLAIDGFCPPLLSP